MVAAADVLLRRHEQYLSSNKECLTPAVEVCQGGKAHGFQEVTVSGIDVQYLRLKGTML